MFMVRKHNYERDYEPINSHSKAGAFHAITTWPRGSLKYTKLKSYFALCRLRLRFPPHPGCIFYVRYVSIKFCVSRPLWLDKDIESPDPWGQHTHLHTCTNTKLKSIKVTFLPNQVFGFEREELVCSKYRSARNGLRESCGQFCSTGSCKFCCLCGIGSVWLWMAGELGKMYVILTFKLVPSISFILKTGDVSYFCCNFLWLFIIDVIKSIMNIFILSNISRTVDFFLIAAYHKLYILLAFNLVISLFEFF